MINNKDETQVTASQSLMYVGPLPPANEFASYEQALPGAAERILALTEKEAQHRHKLEDKIISISSRGQLCALIVSILSLGAVGLSIYFSQPVASIAPAIIAITGLVSIFVNRK
ncbi:MAG: DUF2335 domain-containing protein [Treponema sp.]|nr:DUF2335 domain-containing protein [Treponema sp.]